MAQPNKRRKINITCVRLHFEAPESRIDKNGVEKLFYKCKECSKDINGTKPSNLDLHLQKHEEIYSKISDDDIIERKRLKLLLDCVEFIAVDGNPFSRLQGSGLLSMLEKTLKELEQAGRGVNLTRAELIEVKEMLHTTAENIREKIRGELKNRLFSLMIDITTKRRRSILGVSAQFIDNGKHVIRSIGMLELNESHTGEYLAKIICGLLIEYGVNPQQVISITTDNGANVVKMVRDMPTEMIALECCNQTQIDLNVAECDDEIDNYLQNVPEYSDEQALNILFEDIDSDDDQGGGDNDELINAMVHNLQNEPDFAGIINGVRCVVHTLQLGIHDGLSSLSNANKNVISLCRRIAKTLRLASTAHELKSAGVNFNVPHLDVVTRWCSTYIMVMSHEFSHRRILLCAY